MVTGQNTPSGEKLLGYVERLEQIEAHKKDLSDDAKIIMAEATVEGFAPKYIRHCVKVRRMKPHDYQEAEALRETYLHALGLAPEPPLFRHVGLMSVDIASREQVIEALKQLVPDKGDIIVRAGGENVRLYRDKKGNAHSEDYELPKASRAAPSSTNPKPASPRPLADVPDVDDAGAVELGRQYACDNRPVIDNPFPYGDARRSKFDEGWRAETGGDGFGPDE